MEVRAKRPEDRPWIRRLLTERWGGTTVIANGRRFEADTLSALVAGNHEGLATYQVSISERAAELITLDAVTPFRGVGTALVDGLAQLLKAQGIARLRVTTTNDNLSALRFYQRRGFRIVAVRPGAVTAARRLKPAMPQTGEHGIPICDEIELQLLL